MVPRTIGIVSKLYMVSQRTLRYYEQLGLISSIKHAGSNYRTYDEGTLKRLQQIIILRKLRIPLKEIRRILENEDADGTIALFKKTINELDSEITSLSVIRSVLRSLISHLKKDKKVKIDPGLLDDMDMTGIVDSLSVTKIRFREDISMDEINKANDSLSKLKDVRIIYIPPSAVASAHHVGGSPEEEVLLLVDRFIEKTGLDKTEPGFRVFGFNNPYGNQPDGSDHGYELWVTVPEDMEISPPYKKKKFKGGLYAAHMIPMGAFEQWQWLGEWVRNSSKYELVHEEPDCLEEHLNYINIYKLKNEERFEVMQLDLLIPVKEKS